jgi:hypothetical protein
MLHGQRNIKFARQCSGNIMLGVYFNSCTFQLLIDVNLAGNSHDSPKSNYVDTSTD